MSSKLRSQTAITPVEIQAEIEPDSGRDGLERRDSTGNDFCGIHLKNPNSKETCKNELKYPKFVQNKKMRQAKQQLMQHRHSNRKQSIRTSRNPSDQFQSSKNLSADLSTKFMQNLEECWELKRKASKELDEPVPEGRKYQGRSDWCIYLFLDPLFLTNSPKMGLSLPSEKNWRDFLEGIFHIGVGKFVTPFKCLRNASILLTKEKKTGQPDKRSKKIAEIWKSGRGVIPLSPFCGLTKNEAQTFAAAMIDALGANNLIGCSRGVYKGYMSNEKPERQKLLGKFLLYLTLQHYIMEGERQLFPHHIK